MMRLKEVDWAPCFRSPWSRVAFRDVALGCISLPGDHLAFERKEQSGRPRHHPPTLWVQQCVRGGKTSGGNDDSFLDDPPCGPGQ